MNQVPIWVSALGVSASFLALAGSAVAYVIKLFQEANIRRRAQFLELMEFLDSDKPIATKMTAAYQLRNFPEHADFIIRFCEAQRINVSGVSSAILVAEFDKTKEYMQTSRS